MVSSRLLPVATAVALAATLAAQAPQSPRCTLSPATAQLLRERMGGDPLAVLAAWVRAPKRAPAPTWLPTRDAPADAAFEELLHSALWSADADAAYAAACMLPEEQLDIADIDRWLAAVTPHVFDEDPRYLWDTLKHVMASRDVAALLDDPKCWFADIRYFFLDDLHRSMRPEHMPALAKLTHHEDPFVRRQALKQLGVLTCYTDRHRDVVARTILEWPGPGFATVVDQDDRSRNPPHVPRTYTLPAPRAGWPPLLRAALQRWFLDVDQGKNSEAFGMFLMRWAEDERPADEDRLLLRALLDSPNADGVGIALRALCRIGVDAHLRRVLQDPPGSAPKELVLAALGDFAALRELAATRSDALCVALEFDFEGVWLPWVAEAFGEDAAKGLAAIERLANASGELAAPFRPAPGLVARLLQAIDAFGARLDHARLQRLVEVFPSARSDRLLGLYWATVTPANLADSAVAVLEVTPSIDFVGRLREWAKLPDPAARAPALELLLRLGDPKLGGDLLAHWQAAEAKDPFVLARCGAAPAVREFLEGTLRAVGPGDDAPLANADLEALAAAGMVHGLPESVARGWARELVDAEGAARAGTKTHFAAWREQVLAGDPVAALLAWLDSVPPASLQLADLGTIDDDRMRDLLRKVRNTPGARVQWAIGELALAGDHAARRELDEMRVRNLYGWFDDASANVRTLGRSLDLMPWLIGELETVCCRRNGAAWAIQQLTGFDAWAQTERSLTTQHAHALRWWREVGGKLRWSRLAQRFVAGGGA